MFEKINKKLVLLEILIYSVLFVFLVFGVPFILKKALNTPYPVAVVTSSSMWPELSRGDLVLIKGVSESDLAVGDVVVFRKDKDLGIHRIIEIREDEFVTRGDANENQDEPIKYKDIYGKKIFKVPFLGKIFLLFR